MNEPLSIEFFKYATVSKNFILNSKSNVISNTLCNKQIEAIKNGILTGQLWSYQVVDSWGKIPSGILMGHTTDLGNFDECIRISELIVEGDEEYRHLLEGKYCTAQLSISDLLPNVKKIEFEPFLGWGPALSTIPALKIGVCIPKICDAEQFDDTIRELFKMLDINLNENKTIIQESTCKVKILPSYRTVDIIAIVLFSLFGCLMLLSSIYDYTKKEPIQILTAFSIISNGKKLFKIQSSSSTKNSNTIECLNGIRSLSIIWVVFGHQYFTSTIVSSTNASDILEWFKSPFGLLMANGTVSVDSFFLLSGLLLTWVAFKTMEKTNGGLNIFKMYLHRYLRLTPLLAAIVLFTASLQRYLIEGPFSNFYDLETFCTRNWWSTLLYVANYVHADQLCVGHSWYLCVDTQLFILSPLFLIPLWKWGKVTFIPMIMAIQASMAYVFAEWIYREYHYPILESNDNDLTKQKYTYFVTHARVSPYIIGMILGFFLYKNRNIKIKLSKFLITIGWFLSFLIIATLLFGPYHRTSNQPGSGMTTIEGAIYEPFSRFSWAIALSWVIFACHNGFGGPINQFLSLGIWQPIARLSYGIYLSHLSVQLIWYLNYKTEQHFSNYEIIFMFWACFGVTLCVSVVIVLAFESPVIVIENWIFGNKSNRKNEPVTNVPAPIPVILVNDKESVVGWNVSDLEYNRRNPDQEQSTYL